MRIGILTQPLRNNYGGLLQAFALQKTLKQLGYEAWIIQREEPYIHQNFIWKILRSIKKSLSKLFSPYYISTKEINKTTQFTRLFAQKYINPKTPILQSTKALQTYIYKHPFDAFIVGSDQVWRPLYSPCITNYFFDFIEDEKIKRIAYAASFGVDYWEFSPEQSIICSTLAKKFQAISVREKSGIDLCNKYLHVQATHVLDPTMLLDRIDYDQLITDYGETKLEGGLFYYLLDQTEEKMNFIDLVAHDFQLTPFTTMQEIPPLPKNIKRDIQKCTFPPVTQWLQSFRDAKFIITDSFHGCVFSIIYNKSFLVFPNKERGLSRIESLLKTFELEDRLITNSSCSHYMSNEINWKKINEKRKNERETSIKFIQNNLTCNNK